MTSKFGMAGGIPERRVRPIWDAIDSRQYKNALKLSTSLLTKFPNSPYALALKALILERMGKSEEALSVCIHAKDLLHTNNSILMDDLTLSTLQIVFQRLDHLDMATSCYEYACGKFPNNLELMMGLFNCYVREYSFVKQQQIAIKMYKIVGEERFLLWAVCSIQLQVLCSNGGDKLFLLAEGLLKKHITSHSLHEPEALTVYISLLEQQSKFKDALEIISGKLGSLIMIEVDRLRIQGRLLARAGDYSAAADVFQKVLESCPDDWECFLHYLGCLLEDDSSWCNGVDGDPVTPSGAVNRKPLQLTDEMFISRISVASAFVQKLLASAGNDSIRCPYLAKLEIERTQLLFGKGDVDRLMDALVQYFSRFGHLACFSSDVDVFLQVLTHEKQRFFLEKATQTFESSITISVKELGKSLTLYRIQESNGHFFTLPVSGLEDVAIQMTKMYCKNLPLSKDLDVQENMHGEELLCMAANILVQLFWRTKNLGYLVESIMILEYGLTVRRYVWQYKILLLHLYSHWSALPLSYQWYKSLDVKNILLETITHHILPQLLVSPLWPDLNDLLGDYLKFMDDHFKESADLTFLAYRHRNYSKVIEFVQFKERLQRSCQYHKAKSEASILQLKQSADNIEEADSVLQGLKCGISSLELSSEQGCRSWVFNEDLHSRPWWTPTFDRNFLLEGALEGVPACSTENKQHQIKQTRANTEKTIEKRSLLPRMIFLSVQCASSASRENFETNGSVFDHSASSELKNLLERYVKYLGFSFHDATEMLYAILEDNKSSEILSSDLVDWMNFAVFLNAWNLNSNEFGQDKGSSKPGTWHLVNSLLKKFILEKLRSIGALISSPGCELPLLVQLLTEPLAWHGVVIQACLRSSIPSGKKKKKSGHADQANSLLAQSVRDSVQSLSAVIEEVADWLREQINRPSDANIEIIHCLLANKEQSDSPGKVLNVLEAYISSMDETELGERISHALMSWSRADVAKKVVNGQRAMLSEFLQICESKLKLFQTLKLQML